MTKVSTKMVRIANVTLISFSVHHAEHGLVRVEQASRRTDGLAQRLVDMPDVLGALVLSTCNRVEVLIDAQPKRCFAPYRVFVSEILDGTRLTDAARVPIRERRGIEAITHMFRIAAGLDSMVVGEREISGQLRRALRVAHQTNTSSPTITRVCQDALSSSRKIAQLTGLASQGRSVVNIGLDLVEQARHMTEESQVLIVGTGSYAGATVAALRARNVRSISVYSASGRAHAFAAGHDLEPADSLIDAMMRADVIITCSGRGRAVITKDIAVQARWHRSTDMVFLDLALQRDIDEDVCRMPGVYVISLDDIQQSVPATHHDQLRRAEQIVAEGVDKVVELIRSRRMDPVVIALRDSINAIVAEELQRLPEGDTLDRSAAEYAMKRLAARLAHTPSTRARAAAQSGRAVQFVEAIHEVMGLDIDDEAQLEIYSTASGDNAAHGSSLAGSPKARQPQDALGHDATVPANMPGSAGPLMSKKGGIDRGACPITGMKLADLGAETPSKHETVTKQEAV